MAFDRAGNMFIADQGNFVIRRVDAVTGVISTYAGGGSQTAADGLPATSVSIPWPGPAGVTVDDSGNVYFSSTRNSRIFRVDAITKTIGELTTSLWDPIGVAFDGLGSVYAADNFQWRVIRIDLATKAITEMASGIPAAHDVAPDGRGNLFYSARDGHRVYRLNLASNVTTVQAGNGIGTYAGDGGPATETSLWMPAGLAADAAGNLFIADLGNSRVRRVDGQTGVITTVAGTGVPAPYIPNSSPLELNIYPIGVAIGPVGHLFVADCGNHVILRVSPSDVPLYLHGSGGTANPPVLTLDTNAPAAAVAKYSDSAGVRFSGGNPWATVGTWTANPAIAAGTVSSLKPLQAWVGLKNSDDQGTRFDVRAEVLRNGVPVGAGETRCIDGVTRNPDQAKPLSVAFGPIAPVSFNGTTDVFSVRILTRIGTDAAGAFCGGHSNAVGLRLYFDSTRRAASLGF